MIEIIPIPVTDDEKALGLYPRRKKETNATILRNWITFVLRHLIMLEERRAYHIPNYHRSSIQKFFVKFNYGCHEELKIKKMQYDHRQLSKKFEEIVTVRKAIASRANDEYIWKDIM